MKAGPWVLIVCFSCLAAANLDVKCSKVCPMKTAIFTCMDKDVNALQWQLRTAVNNEWLATLSPTSQQPNRSCILENNTFIAEMSERILKLSFTAMLLTESIKAYCFNAVKNSFAVCNISLAGIPTPPDHINSTCFPNHSVLLSWLPPSDDPLCVEYYVVNVTSEYNTVMITTISTCLLLGPLEPGRYELSVAGVDTANRTGGYNRIVIEKDPHPSSMLKFIIPGVVGGAILIAAVILGIIILYMVLQNRTMRCRGRVVTCPSSPTILCTRQS